MIDINIEKKEVIKEKVRSFAQDLTILEFNAMI